MRDSTSVGGPVAGPGAGPAGLGRAADALALRVAADGSHRAVVLIDGRSGSGKSTLASALVSRIPGAQLVRLDDVYPGWHGLEAASEAVVSSILRSSSPGYRRWDWMLSEPSEWVPVEGDEPLVVEGAGALTRAAAKQATMRVWVTLDAATRYARAMARDGAAYEPWWDVWAAQEERHIAANDPLSLADVIVPG